jgi:acyl-CoA thioesterase-1
MKKLLLIIILLISLVAIAQADEIRIACIGNSITNESIYPTINQNSFPIQLNILLGSGYNVGNFGCSGRTMLKKGDYSYWKEPAFPAALDFKPNIVIIKLGTNDSKPYNWIYKDEFVQDYDAMIDTFRTLETHPEIYLCLPLKAFSGIYNIRDSVIINDIVPMIKQVAQEKNTPTIDLYTFFSDKGSLLYDGIHPNIDGVWEMAKFIYSALTQKSVQEIKDVNLALNKTVLTPHSAENPAYLVDGDIKTVYACKDSDSFIIDLDAVESVDMLQIIFDESATYGYKIETSQDNSNWTVTTDSLNKHDAVQVAVASIEPIETQFIRLTFNLVDTTVGFIKIAELKVLKTAPVHAPIITSELARKTSTYARYNLQFNSSMAGGGLKCYSADKMSDPFVAASGYRLLNEISTTVSISPGKEKYYLAKFCKDGYEVASDTVKLDYVATNVEKKSSYVPDQFRLYQNYPNPFNPVTTISYELLRSAKTKLVVYDCLGQQIKVLVNEAQKAGSYFFRFDFNSMPSGIYLYSLEAGDFRMTKKMLLLR